MIPKVEYQGRTFLNWPEDALIDAGVPENVIAWAKLPPTVTQISLVRAMLATPLPLPDGEIGNAWEHGAEPALKIAPEAIRLDWGYITVVRLNHPTVQAMFSQVIPDEALREELKLEIFQRAAKLDRQNE
ncbi:hypothetical protein TPMD04_32 [Thiohalocapsa phage LS06-2018-MD04]|jgi:hypothetical protein|nr:hypothetical protein TPMD04_32 [Thiohalocapsa phage LS06-2018-MD04]